MKIRVLISGKVQGVFYRVHTKRKAEELGLKGWVKNIKDGKVEAVFEGSKDKVEEMVRWCFKGSPLSKVSKVSEIPKISKEKLKEFEIRY